MLGASWATCRAVSARGGREPAATFDELRGLSARLPRLTLVTATDGNHGRAVAHVARLLGFGARILVPAGTAAARIAAIAAEQAHVELVDGSYDDAVTLAAGLADDEHLVISDTSWPGYDEVPGWVADGYATIFAELAEQLGDAGPPPLVAIQIGVGALACATVRALAAPGRVIVGVEPADAACVLAAVRAGRPVLVPGPHASIIAGLNCGLASPVALPDRRPGSPRSAPSTTTPPSRRCGAAADGLRCGETGASGVAGLLALREAHGEHAWTRLGLDDPRPAALAICTEGPTDPASIERILG